MKTPFVHASPRARAMLMCGATLALLAACVPRLGSGGREARWVGTWEAAPQLTEPRNLPPEPGLSGRTLRQTIHLSIGGARLRVRVSNEFGDGPVTLGPTRIARSSGGDAIDVASDRVVTFGGATSLTIPAGQAVTSDPVDFDAPPLSNVDVTMFIASVPRGLTGHPGSRTTSYIATGNHVSDGQLPGAARTEHWYLLSGVEVMAPAGASAVVVLGNSIADGRGSGTDRNDRWPDNLARRLRSNPATSLVAVLNAGIGGNTVLRGGLGPTALARFDRDVLSQEGARWLIVSEGVNDIGGARPDSSDSVARQLIAAFEGMIARAHARGIRVYGATILPFGGSFYSSPEHEAARETVNRWIRTSRSFDAVIDLDAVMRDPADATRLRPDGDSGDHLHPNERGYQVMADAIDLALFSAARF